MLVAAGVAVCILFQAAGPAPGQTCQGDLDGNGRITGDDFAILLSVISGAVEGPAAEAAADLNGDGIASAADIPVLVQLEEQGCGNSTPPPSPTRPPLPTPTPSAAPTHISATRTPTPTRAATATPPATATPTQTCAVIPAQFGTTNGELTAADCQRNFGNKLRYTDVYTITGTPGQSITVQMTATGPTPIVPFVSVIDADGQFGAASGSPPIQFYVSTTQPYQILVTSSPSSSQQLGTYQLTLTATQCPTPVALALPSPLNPRQVLDTLKATDCPDPGAPSTGTFPNPAHLYTFQVTSVPFNISIKMYQRFASDDIYPAFSVLTPDGIEEVTQDNNWDCSSPDGILICSEARFLALQPGTYTIIAAGGTGRYTLQLASPGCVPTALSNIPSTPPATCSGQSGPGCVVDSLSANTKCAAPLPIPGISDFAPADQASPADLYSFTASAGDVVSVSMTSDDDAHLYLLGPAPGNQLVAQDDDSLNGSDSQLAATLLQPGTYTIVAANNNALYSDDPPINYTLVVQRCPVHGSLSPSSTGVTLNETFSDADCAGFGDEPYRSYTFTGTAGQLVTIAMTSSDVDAFLRLFAPDGSVVTNDNDLFASDTTDAQVYRVLPVDGTYFVEASSNGGVDLSTPSAFTLQARTCPVSPVAAGTRAINAAFADSDCETTEGIKLNTFTFTAPAATAASVVPPSTGCAAALLAEGPQNPDGGCSTEMMDFPALSGGRTYGFVIAANDPSTRGPYTVQFATCPLSVLALGDARTASLAGTDCQAANGAPANWFLVKAGANLMQFDEGVSGTLAAGFSPANVITDQTGATPFLARFGDDPTDMYTLGNDLAALLRIAGATPGDVGTYTLSVDPAWYRQ